MTRTQEIEVIEAERRAAMVAGDLALLDSMIDDEALYVHTNGLRETKAEYMEMVRSGAYRYQAVTQPEMVIRMLGSDVAVVTGRTILHAILPDGSIKEVDGRSIVLWARRGGAGWQMQHYQGTRF
jgi:ketosteroid isomerase-like protein